MSWLGKKPIYIKNLNYRSLSFESTAAKAGYDYRGAEYTENLVRQLIASYGDKLHAFAGRNPKYIHLLDASDDMVQ